MISAVTASVGDTVLDSGTRTQRQRERQVCPGGLESKILVHSIK